MHPYYCPECARPMGGRGHEWGCPNVVRLTPDESAEMARWVTKVWPPRQPAAPALPDGASEDLQMRARQEWEEDQRG